MTLAASFEVHYLQYLDADGRQVRDFPQDLRDPAVLLPLLRVRL